MAGAESNQKASKVQSGGETPKPEPKDELVETEHRVVIDGQEVAYTASTGRFVMRDDDGKARASILFVAYSRHGVADASERPITFSFNGGPGSSSVWLHMGLLGPRRVLAGDVNSALPPPCLISDNEHSLLDVTDLVFIDPVSTGYSRVSDGEDLKSFHGVEQDIESVGEFIRLYVSRTKRWRSPKYLIGESYGTTRAAGLAGWLQDRHGMFLNGIVLISVALDFQTLEFEIANDLPYLLILPSYTAAAWYHGRLEAGLQADLQATLALAEAFAEGPFAAALMRGSRLDAVERAAVTKEFARLTGLSVDYIERSNLRVTIYRFVKELLRDQRRTVGRLDSRFSGIERDAVGAEAAYDPSYVFTQGPYTAALNDYLRGELRFESDMAYEIMTDIYQKWDYGKPNHYVHVAETLRDAMSKNPHLRVYVASGYFDLATPYFATEYTISHLALDPSLTSNITSAVFEAGHMMYVNEAALAQLKRDLAAFVKVGARQPPHE